MALFDHFHNVYDVAFKPRLLRLLKGHVPDQNQPFRSPSELSIVLSAIKTHQALPDKCWAGTCLLGLTCQECSTDHFLASYSLAAESHFVKVACCTSISDLLTRLGWFPNAKKDGSSHAGKLIQPVLKLLNEDSSEAVWEGAIHLLCTLITFYPSSVQHHYDIVEAAIVSKIMSGKCSVNMLEDCWYLMMQKVLLSINVNLNEAFQGLEEAKCNEAIRLLVSPGKDPPPPLGDQKMSGEVLDKAARKSEQLLMSSVTTLMLCCCKMLTTSYPVQIIVPIHPLLALVGRVLVVDGSLSQALLPFVTAIQQEFICSQLPTLHSYGLDLLTAIIKRVRSQLLPHAADIVQLLTEYFRMCALPELRIKAYSVIKILLMSIGQLLLQLPDLVKLMLTNQWNLAAECLFVCFFVLFCFFCFLFVFFYFFICIYLFIFIFPLFFRLYNSCKQETGTRITEFCTHALLALEVLIHPRALPLEDFPTVNRNSLDNGANHKYPENMYSGAQEFNTPFSRGPLGMALGVPNPDYDLYDKDHLTENLPSVDGASSTKVAEKIDHRSAAAGADTREGGTGEEIMVESHQFPESISQEESAFPAVVSVSTSTKIEIGQVASDSDALEPGDSEIATGNDVLKTLPLQYQILKRLVSDLVNESSMDSFPDIVDVNPDSDSE
ncbi:hypothetical protein PVL29_017083 [Vitis rotundifolia]|uniref:Pre-rRNA-processing protein RIX1 N-terminal domain-containing protein n=1 Tax=Vitis rotundifolia TaxID=103349 RepID=A0AA38Z9S7_VITRO|nr:hypothetical protein PVL29_017083 [Vitis rotundifolia]